MNDHFKKRLENWIISLDKIESKDCVSPLWENFRESFSENSSDLRGYGINLDINNSKITIIYKIIHIIRIPLYFINFVGRAYKKFSSYIEKIFSRLILGNKNNTQSWGMSDYDYKIYKKDNLLEDFYSYTNKRIMFSHNTLKSFSYLKKFEDETKFIENNSDKKLNIFEIGAGIFNYGALLSLKVKSFNYVICDLSEVIVSSCHQVEKLNKYGFDISIFFANEITEYINSSSDKKIIYFSPAEIEKIKELGFHFDLFVNHESFAEMNIETVNSYLKFVSEIMKKDSLLFIVNRHSRPQILVKDIDNLKSIDQITSFSNYYLDFATPVYEAIDQFRTKIPVQNLTPNVFYIGKVK